MPVQHFPLNLNMPVYSPYTDLNSPYSSTSSSSYQTDFDSLPSPDSDLAIYASQSHPVAVYQGERYEIDWQQPELEKPQQQYHVPRAFPNYIHSPVPSHPRQQQQQYPATDPVFEQDDWHHHHQPPPSSHYPSHSLPQQAPPRIKQEEMSAFPSAIPAYPAYYDPLGHLVHTSHPHDHFSPAAQPTAYQSPPFPPQHQQQPQQQIQQHQPRPLPFQHVYPATTVHPADISPPESRTSVSPLSPYADVSVNVACDPCFVQQHDLKQQQQHSHPVQPEWTEEDHHRSLESEMGIANMDLDRMVSGIEAVPGMNVVVGGMNPMEASEAVNEEDAEGEEDWDHAGAQVAVVAMQSMSSQEGGYHHAIQQQSSEEERDDESSDRESSATQHLSGAEDGGDGPSVDSGDDFEESESDEEEEEDDDDDEFVLNPRRARSNTGPVARRRRGSAVPGGAAGSPSSMAYASDGGFAVRTRSASSRYNPYQAYSDATSGGGGYYPSSADQTSFDQTTRTIRPRYNSSASTSSASSSFSRSLSCSSTTSSTHTATGGVSGAVPGRGHRRIRPSPSVPVPVPVPNLTKKSRGRRVPTMESLEDLRSAASGAGKKKQNANGKSARMYLCDVEGCGKCFARGEHLKRHVRSIHTYEKPHKCPYPGCGKDFSRHDNLGQHMRVHKDFVPPPSSTAALLPKKA